MVDLLRTKTVKTDQLSALVMSAVPHFVAPRTSTKAAEEIASDVAAYVVEPVPVDAEILCEANIPAVVTSVDASTNARHELAN